jgi:hypothetical protein
MDFQSASSSTRYYLPAGGSVGRGRLADACRPQAERNGDRQNRHCRGLSAPRRPICGARCSPAIIAQLTRLGSELRQTGKHSEAAGMFALIADLLPNDWLAQYNVGAVCSKRVDSLNQLLFSSRRCARTTPRPDTRCSRTCWRRAAFPERVRPP